jgi:FKBP-type peptidyl-prolyl cis-trans isomerase FkpA
LTLQSEKEFKEEMDKEAKAKDASNAKAVQEFITKNGLSAATKTASGMYYIITSPGVGPNAKNGDNVSLKYTGTLLDGTVFDSNVDPKFQHTDPIPVTVGTGGVIPGWDEGITYLNAGAKAKFIIPASLAYGGQEMPPSPMNPKGIPAHSVLVFDVELLDIKSK